MTCTPGIGGKDAEDKFQSAVTKLKSVEIKKKRFGNNQKKEIVTLLEPDMKIISVLISRIARSNHYCSYRKNNFYKIRCRRQAMSWEMQQNQEMSWEMS